MASLESKLDPEVVASFQYMPAISADAELIEVREMVAKMMAAFADRVPPPNPAVAREDRTIPGPDGAPDVPLRIYQPAEQNDQSTPAFIWIHGGGFFLGTKGDSDVFCEQIVLETNAKVISVGYRLAPEHPFPAALDDCYATLQWLASAENPLQVDSKRIAVGGASAGACLAAGLALLARDRGGPALCYQFLLIPVTDDRHETLSSQEVTDPKVWNRARSLKAWAAYLAGSDGAVSPYAAPARAADLSGLPPAYVHVAEQDLLRDEGIAYANCLMQAGVPTELHVYPGTFHGSFGSAPMAAVSQRAAQEHLVILKRVLGA